MCGFGCWLGNEGSSREKRDRDVCVCGNVCILCIGFHVKKLKEKRGKIRVPYYYTNLPMALWKGLMEAHSCLRFSDLG